METKIFGTDGIRGLAGKHPLDLDFIMLVVPSIISVLRPTLVVISQDTRISGGMLCNALASNFAAYGVDVINVGVMPTPSVPCLMAETKADLGIMVSASHNPFEDNGIKIFDKNGFKLTKEQELEIEKSLGKKLPYSLHENIGRIRFVDCKNIYKEFLKKTVSKLKLSKFKIVVDSANGAMSKFAADIFRSFSADVVSIADSPNGININQACGVMFPQTLCAEVVKNRADIGIAFDGDGDRVLICDENGEIINGDHLIGFLAQNLEYDISTVAVTVMSNLGLEKFLEKIGKHYLRTPVGDKFIAHKIINGEAQFGGESSGHLIIGRYSQTGDGLLAALKILECLENLQTSVSQAARQFELCPFIQKNIKVKDKNIADNAEIKKMVGDFAASGLVRIVLRKSGTENLIRLLVEGNNLSEISDISEKIEEKFLCLEENGK